MENLMLEQILEQLWKREITVEKARKLICVLFDVSNSASSNKDTGDFRDPQNYESQDEYFGRK